MAADVLERGNNFDVCLACGVKNSGRQTCQELCREDNDWLWQGDEEEEELNSQFFRFDPRRTPAYQALSQRVVLNCPHSMCNDWASKEHISDEKQRYIEILEFCKAAAQRLRDYFLRSAQRTTAGSMYWDDPGPLGKIEDNQFSGSEVYGYESTKRLIALYESFPCRYQMLSDLAYLKLAADELLDSETDSGVYFFREDTWDASAGVIEVDPTGSETLEHERYLLIQNHSDLGCDSHMEMLLANQDATLENAFGTSFYEAHLSVTAPIRAMWPEIHAAMNLMDDGSDFYE
jgi:hypothetical protein